jgi:5-hydroxyisourate hydrolase-like protein (transthyretin family)
MILQPIENIYDRFSNWRAFIYEAEGITITLKQYKQSTTEFLKEGNTRAFITIETDTEVKEAEVESIGGDYRCRFEDGSYLQFWVRRSDKSLVCDEIVNLMKLPPNKKVKRPSALK